jgi:hypothetical protein
MTLSLALPNYGGGADARLIVQSSPLAGFQFYSGKGLWDRMRAGDELTLVREPDNVHDGNAVRVEWQGAKLGYIPRRDNAHVARQMDHGARIKARIVKLVEHRNPWRRMEFVVFVEL